MIMEIRIFIISRTPLIVKNKIYGTMIEVFRNFIKNDNTNTYYQYKSDDNIEISNPLIEKETGKLSLCDFFMVAIGCGYKSINKRITSIIELIFKYYENLIAIVNFSSIRIFHYEIDLVKRYYLAVADSHPATLDNTYCN